MDKRSLTAGVKSSVLRIGVFFIVLFFFLNKIKGNDNIGLEGLGYLFVLFAAGVFAANVFVGIAGAILFDSTYEAAIKKHGFSISILGDRKSEGFFHIMKASFLMLVGLVIYPFALVMVIKNMFGSKSNMASYTQKTKRELKKVAAEEAEDCTIQTPEKQWMISNSAFSNKCYFRTYKEAVLYAQKHETAEPEKIPKFFK
jgi:hypothetical protein